MTRLPLAAAFFLTSLCPPSAQAQLRQEVLYLHNPSFEGIPGTGRLPPSWYYCGPPQETPPDVHPGGFFKVNNPPWHGNTYIGMVARANGTSEAIGQTLSLPMMPGQCYDFGVMAAQSAEFESMDRNADPNFYQPVFEDYTPPLRLRIWGATKNCEERELLAESPPIMGTEWRYQQFSLKPKGSPDHLILEATYIQEATLPYNGHILLDLASPLVPVDCESAVPQVSARKLAVFQAPYEAAMAAYIVRQAREIAFEEGTSMPVHRLFIGEDGQLRHANTQLYLIGESLRQYPGKRLVAVLKRPLYIEFSEPEALSLLLIDSGLPSAQLAVKTKRYKSRGQPIPHAKSKVFELYLE